MSRASGRKPRRRYRDEDVAKLKAALTTGQRNIEPKTRSKSMRDLLTALRQDIVALRQRGYTVEMIATMVLEGGFGDFAPSTLRRYISETTARTRRRRTPVVDRRPVSPSPPPAQAPNPAQSSATSAQDAGFEVRPDREDL